MNPWVPLAGTLTWNYIRHRRNEPTLCSTARRYIPGVVFVLAWGGLTGWLVDHYCDGFTVNLTNSER